MFSPYFTIFQNVYFPGLLTHFQTMTGFNNPDKKVF